MLSSWAKWKSDLDIVGKSG